jgi:hypothetical protein
MKWPTYNDAGAAALLNPDVPPETKIWRYLDLGKFLSLLQTNSLYCSRVDRLEDKLEGSPTEIGLASLEAILQDHPHPLGLSARDMAKISRRWVYVSCWHENPGESLAMWKLYGREDNTVAIVSTAHRLAKAMLGIAADYAFPIISRVKYIDHRKDDFKAIASEEMVAPFVHKDYAFRYENEVRALLCQRQWFDLDQSEEPETTSVTIPVVLENLLTSVVLPPSSPQYIEEAVRGMVKDRYGLNVPVVRSRLEKPGLLEEVDKG